MSALSDAIAADLAAGFDTRSIAQRHGCAVVYVRVIRRRLGLPPASRVGPRKPHVTEAVAALTEIAARHGVTPLSLANSAYSRLRFERERPR